jgi:hypothetical protein
MNIETEIERLLFRIGAEVANIAKEEAPVRTGNLKKDIQVVSVKKGEVEIGNTTLAKYAKFVHSGTKAHTIKPKHKKALKTPFGPKKSVNHPGTKANPYFERAVDNYILGGGLDRALNASVEKIGSKIALEIEKSVR